MNPYVKWLSVAVAVLEVVSAALDDTQDRRIR